MSECIILGAGTDISDANAAVTDVLSPKTFYSVSSPKKTGTFFTLTPSATIVVADDSAESMGGSWAKYKQHTVGYHVQNALMRTYFGIRQTGVSGTTYGRIYKNGAGFGTLRSRTWSAYVYYTEDLLFTEGDTCEAWGYGTGDQSHLIDNLRILGDKIPDRVIQNW